MITINDLLGCKMQRVMHMDGPRGKKGWFANLDQCVEHPRRPGDVMHDGSIMIARDALAVAGRLRIPRSRLRRAVRFGWKHLAPDAHDPNLVIVERAGR